MRCEDYMKSKFYCPYIKFNWNLGTLISCIFSHFVLEWQSIYKRDHMACKVKNIYNLVFYLKSL